MSEIIQRMLAACRQAPPVVKPVTREASDWFDDGLVGILLKYNTLIFNEINCKNCCGVPDVESFLSLRVNAFVQGIKIACQTTYRDAMYLNANSHDFTSSTAFRMCSVQGFNQHHVASVIYACVYWCCLQSSHCQAGTMRGLLASSEFNFQLNIHAIQADCLKPLFQCWDPVFGKWVAGILTVIKPNCSALVAYLFYQGNHINIPSSDGSSSYCVPLQHTKHCTWLDIIGNLQQRDGKLQHFQGPHTGPTAMHTTVKQAITTYAGYAAQPNVVAPSLPRAIADACHWANFPTIYFPSVGGDCRYMNLLCNQMAVAPLIVMCSSQQQRQSWDSKLPCHVMLVDPTMPGFERSLLTAKRAFARSASTTSGSMGNNGDCQWGIPRPSFVYGGDVNCISRLLGNTDNKSTINCHYNCESKSESEPELDINGLSHSYIFVDCHDRRSLMIHANYMSAIHRYTEHYNRDYGATKLEWV
jgi:hypothetical protein